VNRERDLAVLVPRASSVLHFGRIRVQCPLQRRGRRHQRHGRPRSAQITHGHLRNKMDQPP
jgi:hypothetical protein